MDKSTPFTHPKDGQYRRQPKAGEGQVTINTPLSNVPHNHPRKMQYHIDKFRLMSAQIGHCLDRAVSNSPHGTILKTDKETWVVRDTGLTT